MSNYKYNNNLSNRNISSSCTNYKQVQNMLENHRNFIIEKSKKLPIPSRWKPVASNAFIKKITLYFPCALCVKEFQITSECFVYKFEKINVIRLA